MSGLRSGLQNNLRGKNILVILQIDENNVDETATLVADFRVELNSYKGIEARPDIQEGKGIASLLFQKAEEIAESMGQETVFNYVHPNNDRMIEFLRSKGYTVLNLIEIRKPYKDEKISTTIKVDKHTFDY